MEPCVDWSELEYLLVDILVEITVVLRTKWVRITYILCWLCMFKCNFFNMFSCYGIIWPRQAHHGELVGTNQPRQALRGNWQCVKTSPWGGISHFKSWYQHFMCYVWSIQIMCIIHILRDSCVRSLSVFTYMLIINIFRDLRVRTQLDCYELVLVCSIECFYFMFLKDFYDLGLFPYVVTLLSEHLLLMYLTKKSLHFN